jgi:hypothetical protein
LAHAVAEVVLPGVATGCFFMIRKNCAVAGVHGLVPVTVMVNILMPPLVASLVPKVYVGVVVVPPLVNAPSAGEAALHEIVPLAAVRYPGGIV